MKKLYICGLGPGDPSLRAPAVELALAHCDAIFGYKGYLPYVADLCPSVPRFSTGMTGEVARCRAALNHAAQGHVAALVCSGDGGIYGMASLALQLAQGTGVEVEVIPGITAATAAAALLGAPLGHDVALISLSDRLTPWELIVRRLQAAASGDFCIALYNPKSHGRPDHLRQACLCLMEQLPATRPCGWARQVGRPDQSWGLCTLEQLAELDADMFTTCLVGNSCTQVLDGRLVTPRGYREVE